jgi:Beta-propeller repeat
MRPEAILTISCLLATLASAGCTPRQDAPPAQGATSAPAWVHQLGADGSDAAYGVDVDSHGNLYVVGETNGSLDGQNRGESDAFIARYTADGQRVWIRQLGTTARDAAAAVSTDRGGNVYLAGLTFGSLGGPIGGAYDAFVAKYDPAGNQIWLTQVGTLDRDLAGSVSTDSDGNVYIAGDTFGDLGGPNTGMADAYLAKLDSTGHRLWVRQLGTGMGDVAKGISADGAGDVYIAGQTDGDLGGANAGSSDAFIARYDTNGHRQWIRQLGTTALDYANAIATDLRGNVYIAGLTDGDLQEKNAGSSDAFISKFDSAGSRTWGTQLGTAATEQANTIAVDTNGAIYIAGHTDGDLAAPTAGAGDVYLAKYDTDGRIVWTRQLGSTGNDAAKGICIDGITIYIAGLTAGGLDGTTNRGFDAFLARYA